MTIAGALIGSFVNKLLPELVLTVCLVALLAYTTKETLSKGLEVYTKETKDMARKQKELDQDQSSAMMTELTKRRNNGDGENDGDDEDDDHEDDDDDQVGRMEKDGLLDKHDKKKNKNAAAAALSSSPSSPSGKSLSNGSPTSRAATTTTTTVHGGGAAVSGGMSNYVAEHELAEIYHQESLVPWWKVRQSRAEQAGSAGGRAVVAICTHMHILLCLLASERPSFLPCSLPCLHLTSPPPPPRFPPSF